MYIHNFFKFQAFALLFATITSPQSALADTNSYQRTINFTLGTNEVIGTNVECAPSFIGGDITGVGTGSITANGNRRSLGVLTVTADDCITPELSDPSHFMSDGDLTLSFRNGDTINAHYSAFFIPTDYSAQYYKYKDFAIEVTGGTGRFTGVSGSGTLKGVSDITSGVGVVKGIMHIYK
ncbi:hypothetical protein [Candidatus Nitrotoga sp. M5]|uniref:hypothetical protein n=1 Tax=Candidatus Nitrotoga sp. M5 TaxID=2890409 RepID=UPI001EF4D4B8|nr:hypothetical protein [Candidatus Nitrotoga sp. M5]CAH1387560.1 Flagellar hook-associated protein flgK [Candidatus Nitrotoga sp. M5]